MKVLKWLKEILFPTPVLCLYFNNLPANLVDVVVYDINEIYKEIVFKEKTIEGQLLLRNENIKLSMLASYFEDNDFHDWWVAKDPKPDAGNIDIR
jgi:hypothetical protein